MHKSLVFKHWVIGLTTMVVLLFPSCTGNQSGDLESKLQDSARIVDTGSIQRARYTFYNLYSPIEMSKLFENYNPNFKPELLNPVSKSEYYVTNIQIACNLGIYGIDFNYLRLFKQEQISLEYLGTIKNLSSYLGIPPDLVSYTTSGLERTIENKDSLLSIVSEAFAKADLYLKENERLNLAVYILFGCWTESMYITLHAFDNPGNDVMQAISEQKFSLQSLINLLSNSDKPALEFIDMLKTLQGNLLMFKPNTPGSSDSILHLMDPSLSERSRQQKQITEIKKQITLIRSRIIR